MDEQHTLIEMVTRLSKHTSLISAHSGHDHNCRELEPDSGWFREPQEECAEPD
jgi:hypothetical protein